MTAYYIDATSGDDTNDGTSDSEAWQTIAKVNAFSFSPGDAILFKRGETWTETLEPVISGTTDAWITYGAYSIGDKPLIDMEGGTGACVNLTSIDYLEFDDIQMIGSGTAGCFQAYGTAGSAGDGYTIRGRRLDVVRNYLTTTNADGFSLGATAECEFWDITADKCRPDPHAAGSHQGFTMHTDSKAKVHGIDITDSSNPIYNVGNSICWIEDLTCSGNYYGLGCNGTAILEIHDSVLTGDVGVLVNGGGSGATNSCLIENSTLNYTIIGSQFVREGLVTLRDCTINFTAVQSFMTWGGDLVVEDCTVNFLADGATGYPFYAANAASSIIFRRNTVDIDSHTGIRVLASTSDCGTFEIYQNVFLNNNVGYEIMWIRSGSLTGPKFYNNVFINCVEGIQNDGPLTTANMEVINNIFYGCSDPLNGTTATTISNNCYYDSADEGGTGSITSDPLFTDYAGGNYGLTADSPCRDTGTDVGLTIDYSGRPIPQGSGVDMGIMEYVASGSSITPSQSARFGLRTLLGIVNPNRRFAYRNRRIGS